MNKIGELALPCIKICNKAIVIKLVWHLSRDKEIDPWNEYGAQKKIYMSTDRGALQGSGEKERLFKQMGLKQLPIQMRKNEARFLPDTIQKNQY